MAQVLTITARKLAGVTLGRKFTTQPPSKGNFKSKSVEERKRNSHCAICGEKGHWQGDEACQASKKSGLNSRPSNASTTYRSQAGQKGSQSSLTGPGVKQTFLIHRDDGSMTYSDNPVDHDGEHYGTAFSCNMVHYFQVHEIKSTTNNFEGMMVLDSACQRTCCGHQWYEQHLKVLTNLGLTSKEIP